MREAISNKRRTGSKSRLAAASRAVIEKVEERVLFNAFAPGDLVVYRVGNSPIVLSGTATGGTTTTLTDTGAFNATANFYVGDSVYFTGGTGSGESANITLSTANTLTFATQSKAPDNTTTFSIRSGTLLSSNSAAVYLDEYTPAGTLVQSIPMPTTASAPNNPLTATGTGTNEGELTLSSDGSHLLMTGYDATTGIASISSTQTMAGGYITGVTAASPIVITTASTTGMTNGDPVTISGVGGIAQANGSYYAKVSGSTFSLYSNSTLTTPVTGTGTYTANTGSWTDANLHTFYQRDVGTVTAAGTIDTSTTLGTAFPGTSIYGAAGINGTGGIYAVGNNSDYYTTDGTTNSSTNLFSTAGTVGSTYGVEISNGQLYITANVSSSSKVLSTLGSGLPTTTGQTETALPGVAFSGTSGQGVGYSRAFAFATLNGGSTPDTLYVADNYNDGVDKLSLVGGQWVLNGEIGAYPLGGTPLSGVTGVIAEPAAGGEQLFMTTKSTIYSIVDPYGYNSVGGAVGTAPGGVFSGTPPLITVAASVTNQQFRGIEFVPQSTLDITNNLSSTVTLPENSPQALFAAVAPGTDATVQWEVNRNDSNGFVALTNGTDSSNLHGTDANLSYSGVTGNTLTITNSNSDNAGNGWQYEAVFTSAGLSTSATTTATTVTWTYAPVVSAVSPAGSLPAGGGNVAIAGSNFTGTTSVNFQSTYGTVSDSTAVSSLPLSAGQFIINSPTSITAYIPNYSTEVATAGTAVTSDVTITNSAGTSGTLTADRFIFANAPTVTNVYLHGTTNAGTGIDSGGTSIDILGANFMPGSTITIGGVTVPLANITYVNSTELTITTPSSVLSGTIQDGNEVVVVTTAVGSTSSTANVGVNTFNYLPTTIQNAESLASGTNGVNLDSTLTVTAITSIEGGTDGSNFSHDTFLATDSSGFGIDVYMPRFSGYVPTVGDTIQLVNTQFTVFDGFGEVSAIQNSNGTYATSINVISHNSGYTYTPATITVNGASNSMTTLSASANKLSNGCYKLLDQLFTINSAMLSSPSPAGTVSFGASTITATIADGTGSGTLFYWPTSYSIPLANFNGVSFPTPGQSVNLTGFVDVFSGTPEFVPISVAGGHTELFSVANSATSSALTLAQNDGYGSPDDGDGFGFVQRGNIITVTANRSNYSADAATINFTVGPDSGILGTDYTVPSGQSGVTNFKTTNGVVTGTLNFAANATSASFTIDTATSPGDVGNKIFSVALSSPQASATSLCSLTQATSSVVILDPSDYTDFASNAETGSPLTGENATVTTHVVAPDTGGTNYAGVNSNGTPAFVSVGGENTASQIIQGSASNGYSAFATLTYNDYGNDPTDFFYPGNNDSASFSSSGTGQNNMANIDGIELETVAATAYADTSGPLDIYFVPNTSTNIASTSSTLLYQAPAGGSIATDTNPDGSYQGVNGQLGTEYLLGVVNYNANQPTGGYTPYSLTNLNSTGISQLESAINGHSAYRILIAPGNQNVFASWLGWNSNVNDNAPILRINYGETGATYNNTTATSLAVSVAGSVTFGTGYSSSATLSTNGTTIATTSSPTSTITFSYQGISGTIYSASSTAPTAVGSYSVTATYTPTGSSAYSGSTSLPADFNIVQATPNIITPPTATGITFLQTLAASTLSGGSASVAGSFAFTTPTTAPGAGTPSESVTFTPTDTTDYASTTTTVPVSVAQATPTISVNPTAGSIAYLQTLAGSTLTGGSASTTGTFAFTTPSTVPGSVSGSPYTENVTFTPTDSTDYTTATTTVQVTVTPAATSISVKPTATSISYLQTLAASTLSGGTASVPGSFSFSSPTTVPGSVSGSSYTESVTFTPTDATDYATSTTTIQVIVTKATPLINTPPTAGGVAFGKTLASSTLTGGSANVPGIFTWTTPTTVPTGGVPQSVTFTPTDTVDYTTATTTVLVPITKAKVTLAITGNPGTIVVGTSYSITATVVGQTGSPATTLEGVSVVLTYYVGLGIGGAGSTTPPTALGTYTVVASFAGSADYNAASLSQVLLITIAPPPGHQIPKHPGSPAPSSPTSPTPVAPVA